MKQPKDYLGKVLAVNPGTRTAEEALAEVKASVVEQRPLEGLTNLMGHIYNGRLTQDQVDQATRDGYAVLWPQMLEAYRAGYFFGHQGLDFLSHLMVKEAELKKDDRAWNDMAMAATMLGFTTDPTYMDAQAFAASRILALGYKARRSWLNEQGTAVRTLDERMAKGFANLRDNYNASTGRHGWPQPFDKK